MTYKKISVSLPENILQFIDEASRRLGISRSEYIARVIKEKIIDVEKPERYPTVLWKLSKTGFLKLRSPRYPSRRVKGKWIIEEVEKD